MLKNTHFTIHGSRAEFPINFGYSNGTALEVLSLISDKYIVARSKGTRDWWRVGDTKYYPAVYYLLEVRRCKPKHHRTYKVIEELEEVEPGRQWAKHKKRLIERAIQATG